MKYFQKLFHKVESNNLLIIIVFGIAFFAIYSLLNYSAPLKFTSPDENTNLFFTEHYAKTGQLFYDEPLNELTFGYSRPRNSSAVENKVVPSGFTGIVVVYGTFSSLLSKLSVYITPILSVIGGLFIYCLSNIFFGKKNAIISYLLLLTLIPYWYWSSMTMFNNVPATVFLIGGITFIMLAIKKTKIVFYLMAASMFALNHFFRFTDVIYLIPLLPLLFILRKSINLAYLIPAFAIYLITISPLFILNKILFGNYLSFGYTSGTSDLASEGPSFLERISFFLLPSGFHFERISINFMTYVANYLPLLFLVAMIGLILIRSFKNRELKVYTFYFVLLSVWILIYYGSGVFWGLNEFTLDASYIRYFLPIYVLSIPIATNFLLSIHKNLSILIVSVIIVSSVLIVTVGRNGINDMKIRRVESSIQGNNIMANTEKNSIIITTLADKYIFPERKVIFYGPVYNTAQPDLRPFNYEKLQEIIINLEKKGITVYLLNDRNDLDINKISQALSLNGLKLSKNSKINSLYNVEKNGS